MAGKRSAPIWALAAIMFLGWNEFMAVLWNPVLLILGLVTFVFGYQMYNELDVDGELQRGWVMGAMNIWSRMGDVVVSVSDCVCVSCSCCCGHRVLCETSCCTQSSCGAVFTCSRQVCVTPDTVARS